MVLGAGEGSGGGYGQHVDVVADAVADLAGIQLGLYGLGRAGGVSMLANDDAALGDQSVGSFAFGNGIIPGVGVLDIHVGFGNDALDAKIEGGVAGNHFVIGIGAYIAYIRIGHGARIHELLELHARYHAGDVTALEGVGEDVGGVGGAGSGHVAGASNEGHIGILSGGLHHVGLVAVAVGEYDLAALLRQVNGVVIAGLILGDVVLEDHLALVDAQLSDSSLDALNVGQVVTGVLIVHQNDADLQIRSGDGLPCRTAIGRLLRRSFLRRGFLSGGFFGGGFFRRGLRSRLFRRGLSGGGTSHHAQRQDQCQRNCKKLLHLLFLLVFYRFIFTPNL